MIARISESITEWLLKEKVVEYSNRELFSYAAYSLLLGFIACIHYGLLISFINVIENAAVVEELSQRIQEYIDAGINISRSHLGFSLFINWIAVNTSSFANNIFFFIWPILAAMPFGWSYSSERRSGVYNQLVSRSNLKTYYIAKYISVFLSGGVSVAVPVTLNLLMNALVCPYAVPEVITPISLVCDGYFLSELYYTEPWLYALVWCTMDFLIGGATACICLIAGSKLRFQVMVILMPFAVYVLIDGVLSVIKSFIEIPVNLSPLHLAAAAGNTPNPEWSVIAVLSALVATSLLLGYIRVINDEVG